MVSLTSIVFMVVTLLISIGVPVVLAVYLCKRQKAPFAAVLVGALVFFVSQFMLRIPLLGYLSTLEWYRTLSANLAFTVLFLSLTAGLFEEVGRHIGFIYLSKRHLDWKTGVAYGIGHGGVESILLVGVSYLTNTVFSIMINNGTFDSVLGPRLGPEAQFVKIRLVNLSPWIFLVAGIERLFAMIIQIALSLIVMYGVMFKKISYLFLSILLHTVVNAPALSLQGYSIWYSEAYVFLLAVIGVIFIAKTRTALENRPQD
jgi:uncharacterized membrane protein YhfC